MVYIYHNKTEIKIDAKEICEAAEKANKLLTVIFQSRFSKDIMYVKKLISENAFGKLCMCDLYMKYYREDKSNICEG